MEDTAVLCTNVMSMEDKQRLGGRGNMDSLSRDRQAQWFVLPMASSQAPRPAVPWFLQKLRQGVMEAHSRGPCRLESRRQDECHSHDCPCGNSTNDTRKASVWEITLIVKTLESSSLVLSPLLGTGLVQVAITLRMSRTSVRRVTCRTQEDAMVLRAFGATSRNLAFVPGLRKGSRLR